MPNFSATYTNRSGQTRTLQLQASDPTRARRELRRRGIVPSSLELVTSKPAAASTVFGIDLSSLLEAKPGIREKALFANQLAALVDAGVPIVRSLDLMARQQRMPLFKRALTAVSTDVNQGGSLGAALRSWPRVFDKLTIAMVEAAKRGASWTRACAGSPNCSRAMPGCRTRSKAPWATPWPCWPSRSWSSWG